MKQSHPNRSAPGNGRFLGMGKRSWVIVGGWTYLLLSVWVYLSDKPARPTADERRLGKIRTERAALGREHPWAGRYKSRERALELAPESGYVFARYYDFGPPFEETERGYFREKNGALAAPQSGEAEFQQGLLPIRWGRRRYLIPRGSLKDFANQINSGMEPRYGEAGFFWLRAGDENLPADGFPDLPEPERGLLRERPLDATIIKRGVEHRRMAEWATSASDVEYDTMIIIDVGRKQGARAGMILYPRGGHGGQAEIATIRENSSIAAFTRSPRDVAPKPGWNLSTSFNSDRRFTGRDAALRVTASILTSPSPPPFVGRIASLNGRDYIAGARKNGFTVRRTGRIVIEAVEEKLRDAAPTEEIVASLVRNTGGNAVLETRRSAHEAGLRRYSKALASYRVEWKGLPLAAGEFPYSWDSNGPDWSRAQRVIERNRHPYAQAVDRINSEAAERLLRLPPGGWERLARMDVKDLTAEQRAAFETFWGLTGTYGLILSAQRTSEAYSLWRKSLDNAAAPELAALKKSNPSGDVVYRRLSAAIR